MFKKAKQQNMKNKNKNLDGIFQLRQTASAKPYFERSQKTQ